MSANVYDRISQGVARVATLARVIQLRKSEQERSSTHGADDARLEQVAEHFETLGDELERALI